MIDTVLQQVYRSVILSELQYASCAWWDFTKASDRQRIDNFVRRSVKSGFCPTDLQSFGDLCGTAEEKLFNQVLYNPLYMFCISSDHVNMIKNYQKKTTYLTDLILILLTDCYFLTRTNSCMLFPFLAFLIAQQRSVWC